MRFYLLRTPGSLIKKKRVKEKAEEVALQSF